MNNNPFNDQIWDHCTTLYKEGYQPKDKVQKRLDYYLGTFDNPTLYPDLNETSSANNIIKPIIDTKMTLTLDAMMVTNVVRKVVSFEDIQTINETRDLADILNDCLKEVQRINHYETIKQQTCWWGLIAGFSLVETVFDPDFENANVKKEIIDPRNIRWDNTAIDIKDSAWVSIDMEVSPTELKKKYAKNPDGTWNQEMSDKIDTLAKVKKEDRKEGENKSAVISYTSDQGGGQAFSGNTQGIKGAGKVVKLIKFYMKDDSTLAPAPQDDNQAKEIKQFLTFSYPNGRCIILSPDSNQKLIFEDKAIDYRFGYPLDIFHPNEVGKIEGQSEVEMLIYIQDRVNKAYARLRSLIAKYISTICMDKGLDADIQEGDLVNQFVTFIDGLKTRGVPVVLTNNTLAEIENVIKYISMLKQDAKEVARVNDTMMSGLRQPGTTSGVQVEALKEDPQGAIRTIQRNFKEFLEGTSNKDLSLIKDFYDAGKIIKLTTQIEVEQALVPGQQPQKKQAQYASFSEDGVNLIDEAGSIVKYLKMSQDMEHEVEIVTGTEVPRSRAEGADMLGAMFEQGLFGSLQDPDVMEEYLKAKDLPNWRAIMTLVRKKVSQKPPQLPPADKINGIFQYLPPWAMTEWLTANGFTLPTQQGITPGMAQTQPAIPGGGQ